MDIIDIKRFNEADDPADRGLLANEMHRHDVYSLPDEDLLVFCPECGEMGESFGVIEHKGWCFHGERSIRPGNF
ncbi:MAG TPA: hypothetical protein VFC23_03360 [Thermoanaerobaculia bacterium]|nr:hypothetical protein [Thermoanaerobaculia bacterium]